MLCKEEEELPDLIIPEEVCPSASWAVLCVPAIRYHGASVNVEAGVTTTVLDLLWHQP